MREPASHVVTVVSGQRACQHLVDRGILGNCAPNPRNGIGGEPPAHVQRKARARREFPTKQRRGMGGESDDGIERRGRVPYGRHPHLKHSGPVGAITRCSRPQVAVAPRAVRVVDKRRLLPVAHQAPPRYGPPTRDQRRQHARRRGLVGRHRAPDLGMWVGREPGCHLRRRPQRQFRDHPHVRVVGERLHHLGRQPGAGRQLLPPRHDRIPRQEPRPVRLPGTPVEQGERDLRLRHRIDVPGGQPPLVREPQSGLRTTRRQRHHLRPAEVHPTRERRAKLRVRPRDQPVDQLRRQRLIDSEPVQDTIHAHRSTASTAICRSRS